MQGRPVLVIDNDAESIKLITDTLQPLGYPVVSSSAGEEGLNMAKTHSPLLIFINLAVPGTDGLKVCKSFMSIIDAPLILLTMREGKYDPRYRSQYGIVDFLKKPINVHELSAKVSKFAPLGEASEAAEVLEAEEMDAIEIAEDEVPSAAELAASVASYTEGEEPLTAIEEAEAVEVISDEELVEAAEIVEALPEEEEEAGEWSVPEEEVAEEAPAEEMEAGEWAIPEEEVAETAAAEEEAGEWTMPEEAFEEESNEWSVPEEEAPSAEETPSFEEAPAEEESSDDMDWGDLGEEMSAEESFEEPEESGEAAPEGDDLFDEGGPEDRLSADDSFALDEEEPYDLPPLDEKEYEVRPAALERAKRRKSKSRILVPVLVLLLVGAVAAGVYFFLIAGKTDVTTAPPAKPAPSVAKKTEPDAEPAAPKPKPATPPKKPAAKTPTPEPAPTAKKQATSQSSSAKTYYVQFGAFRSQANAINFQRQLKDSGYETFIKELISKGEPLYLVLLSDSFTDKWTAFKQARQIKETSNIGTSVHME